MSKRSSRIKRQEQAKKKLKAMTGQTLAQEGKEAFEAGKYSQAIKSWTMARAKTDAPASLPAAIAEAYFRRAMTEPSGVMDNLKQAVALSSADPIHRYHLALAHHKSGNLETAEPIYRALLRLSPPFSRAAEPLTQILIEQKKGFLRTGCGRILLKNNKQLWPPPMPLARKKPPLPSIVC